MTGVQTCALPILGWVDGSLRNLDYQKKQAHHSHLSPEKLITVFLKAEKQNNQKFLLLNPLMDCSETRHIILVYSDEIHIQKSAESDAQILCTGRGCCETCIFIYSGYRPLMSFIFYTIYTNI